MKGQAKSDSAFPVHQKSFVHTFHTRVLVELMSVVQEPEILLSSEKHQHFVRDDEKVWIRCAIYFQWVFW